MDAQFCDALANRLAVTEVSALDLAKSGSNPGLGHMVAETAEPFRIRFTPVLVLVTDKFDHEGIVA